MHLTTETRVHLTDQHAWRHFALYWALIRPGSGLIRRDMLATVARLAERYQHVTNGPPARHRR